MRTASDNRLFWLVTAFWILGAPVWYLVVPGLIWEQASFPGGARFALLAAWLTLVLTGVAITNVIYFARGKTPLNLDTPPATTRVLRVAALGASAIELGFIISTTIFR